MDLIFLVNLKSRTIPIMFLYDLAEGVTAADLSQPCGACNTTGCVHKGHNQINALGELIPFDGVLASWESIRLGYALLLDSLEILVSMRSFAHDAISGYGCSDHQKWLLDVHLVCNREAMEALEVQLAASIKGLLGIRNNLQIPRAWWHDTWDSLWNAWDHLSHHSLFYATWESVPNDAFIDNALYHVEKYRDGSLSPDRHYVTTLVDAVKPHFFCDEAFDLYLMAISLMCYEGPQRAPVKRDVACVTYYNALASPDFGSLYAKEKPVHKPTVMALVRPGRVVMVGETDDYYSDDYRLVCHRRDAVESRVAKQHRQAIAAAPLTSRQKIAAVREHTRAVREHKRLVARKKLLSGGFREKKTQMMAHIPGEKIVQLVPATSNKTAKYPNDSIRRLKEEEYRQAESLLRDAIRSSRSTRDSVGSYVQKHLGRWRTQQRAAQRDAKYAALGIDLQVFKEAVDVLRLKAGSLLDKMFGPIDRTYQEFYDAVRAFFSEREVTFGNVVAAFMNALATAYQWTVQLLHNAYTQLQISPRYVVCACMILCTAVYMFTESFVAKVGIFICAALLAVDLATDPLLKRIIAFGCDIVAEVATRIRPQAVEMLGDLLASVLFVALGTRAFVVGSLKDFSTAVCQLPNLCRGFTCLSDMVVEYVARLCDYLFGTSMVASLVEDPLVSEFFKLSEKFLGEETVAIELGGLSTDTVWHEGKAVRGPFRLAALRNLLDASTAHVASGKLDGLSSLKRGYFNSLVVRLRACLDAYREYEQTDMRMEPVCIYLYGGAGRGKTACVHFIMSAILSRTFPEMTAEEVSKEVSMRLFVSNPDNPFMDDYKGQMFILCDDVGQISESLTAKSEYSKIISWVNIYRCPLHCAELYRKGKVDFSSFYVLCTSNTPQPRPEVITAKEALYRRFHLCYEVHVRDKYKAKDSSMLDKALAKASPSAVDIWWFFPYSMVNYTAQNDTNQAPFAIDFFTLIDQCVEQTGQHQSNLVHLKQGLKSVFEEVRMRERALGRLHVRPFLPEVQMQGWNELTHAMWKITRKQTKKALRATCDYVLSTSEAASARLSESMPNTISRDQLWIYRPLRSEFVDHLAICDCEECFLRHLYDIRLIAWDPASEFTRARAHRYIAGRSIVWVPEQYIDNRAVDRLFEHLSKITDIPWYMVHPILREACFARLAWAYQFNYLHDERGRRLLDCSAVYDCRCDDNDFCYHHAIRVYHEAVGIRDGLDPAEWEDVRTVFKDEALWQRETIKNCDELEWARTAIRNRMFKVKMLKFAASTAVCVSLAVLGVAVVMRKKVGTPVELPLEVESQSTIRPRGRVLRRAPPVGVQNQTLDKRALHSVLSNVGSLRVDNITYGRCYGIGGDVYVTTRHVLEELDQYVKSDTVRMEFVDQDKEPLLFELEDFRKALALFPDDGTENIMFCRFGGAVRSLRSKTGLFMPDNYATASARMAAYSPSWTHLSDGKEAFSFNHYPVEIIEAPLGTKMPFVYVHECDTEGGESGKPIFTVVSGAPKLVGILLGAFTDKTESVYHPIDAKFVQKSLAILEKYRGRPMIPSPEPDPRMEKYDDREMIVPQSISRFWHRSTIQPYYTTSKTSLTLFEPLKKQWSQCSMLPSHKDWIMRDDVLCHPLIDHVEAYRKTRKVMNGSRQISIVAEMIRRVDRKISCVQDPASVAFDYRRTLTFREAVGGIPEIIKSVPKATSCGYPDVIDPSIVGGRKYYLGTGDIDWDSPRCKELERKVSDIMETIRSGKRVVVYNTLYLKDELRPEEKVRAGKTRVIECCNFAWFIAMRMLFGGFSAWYTKAKVDNTTAVGLNPYGDDWDALYHTLSRVSSNLVAGDFEKFDHSVPSTFFWAVYSAVSDWYGNGDHIARMVACEENLNRRVVFLVPRRPKDPAALKAWLALPENHILRVLEGQALVLDPDICIGSGNFLTALFGSIVMSSMIYGACVEITCTSVEMVFKVVWPNTLSDDHIAAVTDPRFNCHSFREWLSQYGMVYTPATKEGELPVYYNWSNVQYLKRGFKVTRVRRPGRPWCAVFAPLEQRSIWKQVIYTKKSIVIDEFARQSEEASKEAALHGADFYRSFVNVVGEAWRLAGKPVRPFFTNYDVALASALRMEAPM